MNKRMKSRVVLRAALVGMVGLLSACKASAAVIINEVYGGGGSSNAAASFKQDFVELYNTGSTPVSLAGYLLQYSAAAATSFFSNSIFAFDTGSVIGAGDYLTINTGTIGTGGTPNPTANGTGGANLAAASGSVRLLDNTGAKVDLVGYGTVFDYTGTPPAVKVEGPSDANAAPLGTISTSLNRTGFADTDVNSADFTSAAPTPTLGVTSTAVAVPTPEPVSLGLASLGAVTLLGRRRRRTA